MNMLKKYVEDNLEISIHIEYLYGKELLDAIVLRIPAPIVNNEDKTIATSIENEIQELKNACDRYGLKFCLYFSQSVS